MADFFAQPSKEKLTNILDNALAGIDGSDDEGFDFDDSDPLFEGIEDTFRDYEGFEVIKSNEEPMNPLLIKETEILDDHKTN